MDNMEQICQGEDDQQSKIREEEKEIDVKDKFQILMKKKKKNRRK